MLKGKEAATSQLRSRVTRAVEKLRGLDWPHLVLFNANQREPAYCIHLVLAALFFSPFLLFGHVVAASTDSLLESYPSLLLARQNFLHGSLGLWNPYVFSGMPRAAEAVPTLFYPEHWILFLVPLRYLFATITFFAFIKVWLVGVAAYHFYCAELLQRRWALFASIAFQLSGMTIWLLGVYVSGLSLMLFYLILLALIWTSGRRSSLANYLLWSLVTTLMLMAGDIALSSYALLAAGILFLYRTLSRYDIEPLLGRFALFTASSLTALAIFSIRLFPTLAALQTSSAESCCLPEFNNSTFLIARYFDTEILGVHFDASIKFFRNISHLFEAYHLHFAAPQFFGIAAALLALWMLSSEKNAEGGILEHLCDCWACFGYARAAVRVFFAIFALSDRSRRRHANPVHGRPSGAGGAWRHVAGAMRASSEVPKLDLSIARIRARCDCNVYSYDFNRKHLSGGGRRA